MVFERLPYVWDDQKTVLDHTRKLITVEIYGKIGSEVFKQPLHSPDSSQRFSCLGYCKVMREDEKFQVLKFTMAV
jgi:hypothetical protein